MSNINTILNAIQTSLKAPKSQFNKFGNYYYRSCEDILEAVKPFLNDLKAVLVITDDLVQIGDRYYVKATATLSVDGESVSASAYAREAESKKGSDESQITGATSSYARKIALNGLFAIDDNKDADSTNTESKDEKPSTASYKPKGNDMGNLAPAPVAKPQTPPQPVVAPTAPTPAPQTAPAPGKPNPDFIDDAWEWNGSYGFAKGFPLKVLYQSNPNNLNEVYKLAKAANDTDLLRAIKTIARVVHEAAQK